MAKKLYVHDLSHWSSDFAFELQCQGWRIQTDSLGADYSTKGITIHFMNNRPDKVTIQGHHQVFFIPREGNMYLAALSFWKIVFGKRDGEWIDEAYASLAQQ